MRAVHALIASLLLSGITHAETPSALSTRTLTKPFVVSRAATQYSVAVIEDVPKLLRGHVIDTMRDDLPASMHARFLVATEHSAAWKEWTRHAAPDAAYVLLLDAGRRTLWRGAGAVTDGQLGSLKAAAR